MKTTRAIVLFAAISLALNSGVRAAEPDKSSLPLLFETDFSGDLSAWTMTDASAWKLVEEDGDGKLSLHGKSDYEPPVRSPHNIARVKDVNVSDFVLDVDAKQTGREYGHRDLCFFFGYQDPAHYYYVHLATKADAHANSIFLVNGEPRVSIAQKRTDGTDWSEGYHHIRIERNTETGTIKVYFNDMENPVMETVDKTFLHGTIGLGSFDDTGNFDNFKIHGTIEKREE